MKSIDERVEVFARTTRNVLKRNLIRFVAALPAVLASFVAAPNAALATAPQHHDQVPGFYRMKVGDLEVTALFGWFWRIPFGLAKRDEGDHGWRCRSTARRSAHAGSC